MNPWTQYEKTGNAEARALGNTLIAEGRVGTCVLAGGQGTRLGIEVPKGTFPITPIRKKSLFQVITEKVIAASTNFGRPLDIAFMTSPENHSQSVSFFEQHDFFGLAQDQIHFFTQSALPLLSEEGHAPLMHDDSSPYLVADGNGSFFWDFCKSGLAREWAQKGIDSVVVIIVDNPLADPFDAELVGIHNRQKNDATIMAVEKTDSDESVGLVVEKEGKLAIVEYSDMKAEDKAAKNEDGSLKFKLASISYFCFSMDFIRKISLMSKTKFPLHEAIKIPPQLSFPAVKQEYFIFDMLSEAAKTSVLLAKREDSFAALKNKEGRDSPVTAVALLEARDRRTFEAISGTAVPQDVTIELATAFHYPTPALREKWKGKTLPHAGYVEA